MEMKEKIFGAIVKYALLLAIFYAISFAFSRTIRQFEPADIEGSSLMIWIQAPYLFGFVLNLVTAYTVALDIKKHKVKTKYVILATTIYRPLGVIAFLLFFLLEESGTTNDNEIQHK